MAAGDVQEPPEIVVLLIQGALLATPPGRMVGLTASSAPLSNPPVPLILMVDRSTSVPMVMGSL